MGRGAGGGDTSRGGQARTHARACMHAHTHQPPQPQALHLGFDQPRIKNTWRKRSPKFQKQTLNLPHASQQFTLYQATVGAQGFERLWILVSLGVLASVPTQHTEARLCRILKDLGSVSTQVFAAPLFLCLMFPSRLKNTHTWSEALSTITAGNPARNEGSQVLALNSTSPPYLVGLSLRTEHSGDSWPGPGGHRRLTGSPRCVLK